MEDGGAPPGVEAPVYAVVALQAGRSSVETRSDAAPEPSTPVVGPPLPHVHQEGAPAVPSGVRAVRGRTGSVEVSWRGGDGDLEYRVRCLTPDGRWRVVGRTHDTSIEDGGAPAGPVAVYAVSAAMSGIRSAEGRSDGM